MIDADRINPHYLSPRTRIGPYEIVDQVATGGYGCVYKVARDGKTYALKIGRRRLSELLPDDREYQEERLDREIAALKSLHHPNIVPVHSFERWPDLEGGFPYLVMDFIEGTRLYDWRADAAPSLARICTVFEKIAGAVQYMHRLGIYHRDLKSENVLVRTDGEPILIDFGIARARTAYTVTRAATIGTITHYAPEYARYCDSAAFRRGEPFAWQPATDLHSIGYMLYEVLTGRPPFPRGNGPESASEAAILLAIKTMVPKRPSERNPGVPATLDAIVLQLLEKDPARRPESAQALVTMLGRAREEGGAAWQAPFDVPDAPHLATETAVPELAADTRTAGDLKLDDADASWDVGAPPRAPATGPDTPRGDVEAPEQGFRFDGQSSEVRLALEESAPGRVAERSEKGADVVPTAIREAKAQLAASAPRWRPGRLVFGASAIALVLLLIVLLGRSTAPANEPKTLLSAPEPRPPQTAPSNAPQGVLQVAPAPAPAPAPPPQRAEGAPARKAATRQPAVQSDTFEEELEREYGRPTILPDGEVVMRSVPRADATDPGFVSSVSPSNSRWLMVSQRLQVGRTGAPSGPKPLGVPLGAHIRARLLTNLDSRTIGNGPVEAVLPGPFLVRGAVVLPARTLAYGTASDVSGRFTVRFSRLRLPDDRVVAFDGIALARDDGKPGLAAQARIKNDPERRERLGKQIARSTGNLLLDTIAGGTGHDIARNAGRTLLNQEDPATGSGEWTLLLDAGVIFEIFVEQAF